MLFRSEKSDDPRVAQYLRRAAEDQLFPGADQRSDGNVSGFSTIAPRRPLPGGGLFCLCQLIQVNLIRHGRPRQSDARHDDCFQSINSFSKHKTRPGSSLTKPGRAGIINNRRALLHDGQPLHVNKDLLTAWVPAGQSARFCGK